MRESLATVLRWLKWYITDGVEGLKDAPRPGRDRTVTYSHGEKLIEAVRHRSLGLDLDFSTWTLQRLADYMECYERGILATDDLEGLEG